MQRIETLLARLRFRHLQLLLAFERAGSLRGAAASLHLTQPALSKALKEIEAAFGFALFERTPRGLRPNGQGAAVLRGAELLLAELGHLHGEAEAAASRAAAVLRIGAPPFVALSLLPAVLRKLLANDPPIHAVLREERVPQLLRALLKGEVDALLTTFGPEAPSDEERSALRYEHLLDEEIVIIAPRRHALVGRRRVPWALLAEERWILPNPGSFNRGIVEHAFLHAGLLPPRPVIESTSPMTNVRLVAEGLGLGIVPAVNVREAERAGLVVRLGVHPAIRPVPVALVYRSTAIDHPRIKSLREALAG